MFIPEHGRSNATFVNEALASKQISKTISSYTQVKLVSFGSILNFFSASILKVAKDLKIFYFCPIFKKMDEISVRQPFCFLTYYTI